MARVLLALVLAAGLSAPMLASSQLTGSRLIETRAVDCTTTFAAHVAVANPNRINLTLQNVGTIHAGLAGQDVGTAHLAARGLFTLHAGSTIEFANFQGGLTCLAAGPVRLQVIEELR